MRSQCFQHFSGSGKPIAYMRQHLIGRDRVVFLGQGGRLCYFGPPDACLRFFGVKEDFADIYNQLEKPETVIDQAQKFYSIAFPSLLRYKIICVHRRLSIFICG